LPKSPTSVPKPAAVEKANDKNKSNKDAGQRTPGDFAISDPGPPTTKLHHKNVGRNTKPSDSPARKPNRRGSRLPILPEPARVLGPGSLRKARPRRSDYYRNTQSSLMNTNAQLLALQSYSPAR
jgi:hypothetical protein